MICLVLAVGVVGSVMIVNQKDSELEMKTDQISGLENEQLTLETHVSSMQANVSSLQSEVVSLENDKVSLETQVSSLQTEATTLENENSMLETNVSSLQTEKASLETQVANLQSETSSLNNDVDALESQVSSLQTEVVSLESEVIQSFDLGYVEGESEGYQFGYDEGYLQGVEDLTESGWYLMDPTYSEAITFINSDKSDENDYTNDYVCYDFTADFNDNAFQAGYRCGFVYIEFSDSAHAIACFNTTDNGLIYIEPQNDEIVTLTVGHVYLGSIIVDFGIIW